MKTIQQGGWVFYVGDDVAEKIDRDKCGKWMYYFDNQHIDFAKKICKEAVEKKIVAESKHTDIEHINTPTGVCCFYLNGDDLQAHKRTIQYFIDNSLIRKTKTGKLYNISFKYDYQTRAGKYGDDFKSEIKLESFLNLETGEWKK